MTEAPPPPENKNVRQGDAGAAFVLESKGENNFFIDFSYCNNKVEGSIRVIYFFKFTEIRIILY